MATVTELRTETLARALSALAVFLLATLLAGCETMPGGSTPSNGTEPAVARCTIEDQTPACVCQRFGDSSSACQCARDPNLPQCQPCPDESVSALWSEALVLLSKGRTDVGEQRLRCVLAKRSDHRGATLVLQQLEDPYAALKERFGSGTTRYTMQSGDTLGMVASRCLGNGLYFVGLALTNGIADPSRVEQGRRLQIPGNAPCQPRTTEDAVVAEPEAPDVPVEPASGEPASAAPGAQPAAAPASPDPAVPDVPLEQPDAAPELSIDEQVDALLDDFANLLIQGEETVACAKLDEILELDPGNEAAQLNREDFCSGP